METLNRTESDDGSDYTSDDDSYSEEGTEMELDEDGESINIDSILAISTTRTSETDNDADDLRATGSDESLQLLPLHGDKFDSTATSIDPLTSSSHNHTVENTNPTSDEIEEPMGQHLPQNTVLQPQSEWDKALLTGRQSTGAASEFFVPQHPILSTDSSEFYSTSNAAQATTPATPKHRPQQANEQPSHATGTFPPLSRQRIDVASRPTSEPAIPPPPRPQTSSQQSTPQIQSKIKAGMGSTIIQVQTNTSSNSNYRAVPIERTTLPATTMSNAATISTPTPTVRPQDYYAVSNSMEGDLSAGVLPDVLMTMRQKIESMTLFDSEIIRMTSNQGINRGYDDDDPMLQESRESLKRSSQQSISAAVLVSLAHKRYERRRLAAMEIEKVVRSLVVMQNQHNTKLSSKNELDRVRAILLLLSDDYVRSTSEDARKGGVVALAACAIGLKKANDHDPTVQECRDLILASVVHACQDHSQRVRYYATESLFNVVKVIPSLAVQHFFILFEVLRSLFADVDSDVRSGADLLDRKLKEVIVAAMNAGIFAAEQCVPVFARFVCIRNKATKRLTLTWLQELNEKLIGAPILEFLHLFLSGVMEMVSDPSIAIRQSALAFLQSVLPKLLVVADDTEENDDVMKVDFDKILQSLVATMEHANPFVRKVAMYWMSRIVKAHMTFENDPDALPSRMIAPDGSSSPIKRLLSSETVEISDRTSKFSSASISVRNAVPHLLPGILLSVGDNFVSSSGTTTKDAFLPDQTTRALAKQTNLCLENAVRRDGMAYVEHLDGFIVALREEMASPGGFAGKNPPAVERTPYRMDVQPDGTGIETAGWFRSSREVERKFDTMVTSRLCALQWVITLYESVVPDVLKADYAREFVFAIIHQLQENPPESIVFKSLEVLARITVPVSGEETSKSISTNAIPTVGGPSVSVGSGNLGGASKTTEADELEFPINDTSVCFAMRILQSRQRLESRNREVFAALIQLHSDNRNLLGDFAKVITYMCKLQPPEFVMVSFAVEVHRFLMRNTADGMGESKPSDLRFVSTCIQHMNHVLFNNEEARELRDSLKDCIATKEDTEEHRQRSRLFYILLHSFSHNIAATLSLCLWVGAYTTAFLLLSKIDPLDINLIYLLEIDRLVEMLERPLFRHLHVRMLECDLATTEEGSGTVLFQVLKSLLMILPQSLCYRILRDRLVSVSRFRQSTTSIQTKITPTDDGSNKVAIETKSFVDRALAVRNVHCAATWQTIRHESLEVPKHVDTTISDDGATRRAWLGYASKQEQLSAELAFREAKQHSLRIEHVENKYHELSLRDDS